MSNIMTKDYEQIDYLRTLRDDYACPCDESTMYDNFLIPYKAEGIKVWSKGHDEPFIDMVLGYSSLNFGHNYPALIESIRSNLRLQQIHSFHTEKKLVLSKFLADKVSKDEKYKVYFDIGGTSVVEAAIRLCRNFHKKKYIISFSGAYHGASYLASSISDDRLLDKSQYGFNNLSEFVINLPFPSTTNTVTVEDCMQKLQDACSNYEVSAVIVEPIQGANGFIFPKNKFLQRLREVTQANDVSLIIDEIQAGMGRSGYFFAYQKENILPDIVLLSKSLAGGFYPLSCIIAKSQFFDVVAKTGTAFQSTFNNNPFGVYVASEVMKLLNTDLLNRINSVGKNFLEKLFFIDDNPYIFNLRGQGLALAFNVTEKNNPDRPSKELAHRLVSQALKEKLILYSCGVSGNVIKLAPSFFITDKEISLVLDKLLRAIENSLKA